MSFHVSAILRNAILPMILACSAGSVLLAADPTPGSGEAVKRASAAPEPPTYIILKGPSDLSGLMNGAPQGSLVIRPDQLGGQPGEPLRKDSGRTSSHVVRSVKMTGKVVDELADLTVEMEIDVRQDGPVWIPIRLDGKILFAIREGDRDLLRHCPDSKGWEVQLERKGIHRIRVELKVPVKSILDRSVLDLEIPNAADTSIELDVPQRVSDPSAGLNEPLGQISLGPGNGFRLVAHLPPRARLDVSWRRDSGSDAERQPLISVQGEIAIDAELDTLRASSSWLVRCVRGSVRSLEIALDNQDEVRDVLLEDQVVRYETERVGRASLLKIPLADPMIAGGTRRLTFLTRRANPPGSHPSISFRGFAFSHAKDQSGAIAVFPGVNLWADYALAQSVLRINASEMPADLRARPGTPLAFQFLDQPFELKLSIEASPPLASAETRTLLRLGPEVVNQVTWIDLQWIRGRLFDVEVGIPEGLQLTACGPQELIEPVNRASNSTAETLLDDANRTKVLKIRLSAQAMDRKKITIRLDGQQRYRPSEPTRLHLFQPRHLTEMASRFAIFGGRDLSIEAWTGAGQPESGGGPRFSADEESTDWPWPGVATGTARPPLILRTQGFPSLLPLRVVRNPRSVTEDVMLTARLTRRGIDVQQQSDCEVRHGVARAVELIVPAGIGEDWDAIGLERAKAVEIERTGGERRYRLMLPDPPSDRFTLRFRYRIPFHPELGSKAPRPATIPWIAVAGSLSRGVRMNLGADPGVNFVATRPEWSVLPGDRPGEPSNAPRTAPAPYRLDQPSGARVPFGLEASAAEHAGMPRVVIPRAFLRTALGYDRQLHTKGWFSVETREDHLSLEWPPEARLIRARVDGRTVAPEEIEAGAPRHASRIPLAIGREERPLLLEVEYDSAVPATGDWSPPRLLEDAPVLETYWEIVLPWNLTAIGSPLGWSDDNQWSWGNLIWRRRPALSTAALLSRVGAGPSPDAAGEGSPVGAAGDTQNYLFSRAGSIAPIRVWIVPRSWLVGVCSGTALLAGIALMLLPRRRATAFLALLAASGLAAGALLHPSTMVLLAQSSIIGFILAIMGFTIRYMIDIRRPVGHDDRESHRPGLPAAAGSTLNRQASIRPAEVGSDESTAIRVRVASTMEYRAKGEAADAEASPGSKIELAR